MRRDKYAVHVTCRTLRFCVQNMAINATPVRHSGIPVATVSTAFSSAVQLRIQFAGGTPHRTERGYDRGCSWIKVKLPRIGSVQASQNAAVGLALYRLTFPLCSW